ncbi:hypothetical protein R1flu_003786 [Riccia fluitans]|uniref:BZIP domain-containing protein n=1 Tax=Riccia fluitans TaxID=41844 RepID=A0ABD1YAB1_9MARC
MEDMLVEEPPETTDGVQQEHAPTEEAGESARDPAPMVNTIPDLSVIPSNREQIIESNRLEKERKKEERKRETRRKRAERTRAREHFKEFQKADRQKLSELQLNKQRLEEVRLNLQSDLNEDTVKTFKVLEKAVRKTELLECSILRRRSWMEWIEKELYEQPTVSPEDANKQVKTLTLIEHSVLEAENLHLLEAPTAKELEETVKNMPAGKSPGEDRLPIEILRELWSDVGQCCLDFIQEAWRGKRIGKFNTDRMSGAQSGAVHDILGVQIRHWQSWGRTNKRAKGQTPAKTK